MRLSFRHPSRTNQTFQTNKTRRLPIFCLIIPLLSLHLGCAHKSYITPNPPASFQDLGLSPQAQNLTENQRNQLTDQEIRRRLAIKPLASFPAHVALARLQGGSRYYNSYQNQPSAYLISVQDERIQSQFEPLTKLQGVTGVVQLNRMLVPSNINNERQLRAGAASLHADLILLYTFDSQIETDEKIPYAGLFTIGLFPDRSAKVTVTAYAMIVDVRSAFVYGVATGTASHNQLASAWTNSEAVKDAMRSAEQDATANLMIDLTKLWHAIIKTHAPQLNNKNNS